jgi:hypothetical protein
MKDLQIPCLIQNNDALTVSFDPTEELVDIWVKVSGEESMPVVFSKGGAMLLIAWLQSAYRIDRD